jgi:hypothetical protein
VGFARAHHARQTKIGQIRRDVFFQQNIRGLDVAMQNALLVLRVSDAWLTAVMILSVSQNEAAYRSGGSTSVLTFDGLMTE